MSAYACVMSAYAYASIHANPRKRACARAHTTRTHKHTNTHIYTHTPMQTRIFPNPREPVRWVLTGNQRRNKKTGNL